jgi:uncharacterized membrane protein (DUF485 family)
MSKITRGIVIVFCVPAILWVWVISNVFNVKASFEI